MNLLCENCKAIRPVSGEKLKCEVCGWECKAAARAETDLPAQPDMVWAREEIIGRGNLLRLALWGIVIVSAFSVAVHFLTPGKYPVPPGKYRLALKYGVTEEQVFLDAKPPGCDFTDSPLGDKHCHFEQSVYLERECLTPNCPVKSVHVTWHKVRD